KSALALHLIEFLRKTEDKGFRRFVFNDLRSTGLNLDRVLNMIFQAEFHIPRMFCGDDYSKYVARPINLREAINASNFEVISESITNGDLASEAMYYAIKASENEIVSYLFENEHFNASCFLASTEQGDGVFGFGELTYILSDAGACPLILEQFLERKLIDPHTTFKRYKRGQNMMDNAIKYANTPEYQENSKRLIDVLQKYGARPS
ncbi:MAG TPA: T3SS effector OspC family protein, partial [Herbaspirillum sp.]|nr:T3SS effector OspC family protein [Herbaspirillum sp.]